MPWRELGSSDSCSVLHGKGVGRAGAGHFVTVETAGIMVAAQAPSVVTSLAVWPLALPAAAVAPYL